MTTSTATSAAYPIPAVAEKMPVDTVADILRALQNPDVAAAVRQHILTQELLLLPAAFAKLSADVETIKADVADLKTGQARLDTTVTRIERHVEVLRAESTVNKARRMVSPICRAANLRRPRWMNEAELFDLWDAADTSDIPPGELESCQRADLVLKAVSKADGSQQYAVIECSATITGADVRRIRRNAGHYQRATGCVTHAYAVGDPPPLAVLDEATRLGVHCLTPSGKNSHPD